MMQRVEPVNGEDIDFLLSEVQRLERTGFRQRDALRLLGARYKQALARAERAERERDEARKRLDERQRSGDRLANAAKAYVDELKGERDAALARAERAEQQAKECDLKAEGRLVTLRQETARAERAEGLLREVGEWLPTQRIEDRIRPVGMGVAYRVCRVCNGESQPVGDKDSHGPIAHKSGCILHRIAAELEGTDGLS